MRRKSEFADRQTGRPAEWSAYCLRCSPTYICLFARALLFIPQIILLIVHCSIVCIFHINLALKTLLFNMSSTKLVPLGKGGPLVPRLGFGLMGLSYETYGAIPADEERFALLDRAYGLGERHWDSAEFVPFFSHTPPILLSLIMSFLSHPQSLVQRKVCELLLTIYTVSTETPKNSSEGGSSEPASATRFSWPPNSAS